MRDRAMDLERHIQGLRTGKVMKARAAHSLIVGESRPCPLSPH